MAQNVKFNGHTLNGTLLHQHRAPRTVQQRPLHFWGVVGAGWLMGQRKEREIVLDHLLHNNFAKYTNLAAEMAKWDTYAGESGTLVITNTDNGVTETFPDCVYQGYYNAPEPADGPLKDVAGTLDGGWFIRLFHRFVQLST